MLHILLLILKLIGIVLALILGLLLLAVICVFFVPVRYLVKANGKLGADPPFTAEVKVSWLFHIVNAAFSYPEPAKLRIRIFCFPIPDFSKLRKKEKKEENNEAAELQENTSDLPHEEEDVKEADNKEKNAEQIISEKTVPKDEKTEMLRIGVSDIPEEGLGSKIKQFVRFLQACLKKLIMALENIKYTIGKICDKIKKIIEDIQYYAEVFQSEIFKAAFGVAKKQLLRVLCALRPKKININLILGTGDPASTGQILALYGIMYPFVGNNIFIQSDFENKIVEGSLYMKGKITVFSFLLAAFRLYTDKNIRKLLKLLKREEA